MKIAYFGEIADQTKKLEEDIDEISTLNGLINYLKENYELNASDFHIAVNHNLIEKSSEINFDKTDEIAILSPFAGG